jgi:transcriptional regulator GlxA family with amidase domain
MRFGVFIYDGGEPIDLATYGVLSMARRVAPAIELYTIAPQAGVVRLSSGLRVIADYCIRSAPECNVLIVTGGPGWETQATNTQTLEFLRSRRPGTRLASVMYGSDDTGG